MEIIQRHYMFLVEKLVAKDSGLVGELYRDEVLTSADMDSIRAETTSSEQNKKLLTVLSRKTKVQFDQFLDALVKTGQQHIRNYISREMKRVSCYTTTTLLLLLQPLPLPPLPLTFPAEDRINT